jgi:hypothetical protein
MAKEPIHNLPLVNPSVADADTGSDSRVESIAITTSSPTRGAALMAKDEIPKLSDFLQEDDCYR